MKCAEAKLMFSPYLDGALSGAEMQALCVHFGGCSSCDREYALLRQTQELLAKVGRRKAPADLALKLRLAISREAATAKRPPFHGLLVRLENLLNAFMVPATAGMLAAVAIFGFVMGLTLPELQARNANDVPLMLYTESGTAGILVCGDVEFGEWRFAGHRGIRRREWERPGLPDYFRYRTVPRTAAGGEEDVDLHDFPSGNVDGTAHAGTGGIVIFENQRARIDPRRCSPFPGVFVCSPALDAFDPPRRTP